MSNDLGIEAMILQTSNNVGQFGVYLPTGYWPTIKRLLRRLASRAGLTCGKPENSWTGTEVPYVQRNNNGEIIALWREPPEGNSEFIPATDPDVMAFLDTLSTSSDEPGEFSLSSDLQMVRVIEDLIDLLITKRVIVLTDLPVPVQNKLLRQRAKREHLLGNLSILNDSDKGLF